MPQYGSKAGSAVPGGFAFAADISPSQITSNQNDYAPTGHADAVVLRLDTDAARSITGLQGGADGQFKILMNIGAFPITLVNASASSTAAYRFDVSADIILWPKTSVALVYDATVSRWKLHGGMLPSNLTGGFTATTYDNGTKSSGTFTPDALNGQSQKFGNNGAHTLAPPSPGSGKFANMVLTQTNGASAGAITRSGFTKTSGDALTTTNGHKFRHFITVDDGGSHCHTQALQ